MQNARSSWQQLAQYYWWMALGLLACGLAVDLLLSNWYSLSASLVFSAVGFVCWYSAKRGWMSDLNAVVVHILVGSLCAAYEGALPLAVRGATWTPDLVWLMFGALSLIGVLGGSVFGGWWGFGAGVLIHILLIPHNPVAPYVAWVLGVFVGLVGVSFHYTLARLINTKQALERLAYYDSLTGLHNRRAAQEQYRHHQSIAERHGLKLWLVVWDLDNLKEVNDTEGHAAGDRFIHSFADTLRSHLRDSDVAFRVGGDEFWSLHFGLTDGAGLVERVRGGFAAVSAGWVKCTGLGLEEAVHHADQAMYADKEQRRKRSSFSIGSAVEA